MSDIKKIKVGDKVVAYYREDRNSPSFSNSSWIEGEIINMPRNAGDLIQIKNEKGDTFAINPYCSTFEGLYKRDSQ